jgi:hypothetical protein
MPVFGYPKCVLGTTFYGRSEGKIPFGYHILWSFRRQNAFWVPDFRVIPKAKRVLGTKGNWACFLLKCYLSVRCKKNGKRTCLNFGFDQIREIYKKN